MARATPLAVKQIISTDLSASVLSSFINAAHRIVEDHNLSNNADGATLKEVETWLAAHLLASTREQQAQTEQIGNEYRVTYQGKTGLGLESTYYGQTVMMLDHTGRLAAGTTKRPKIVVATTPEPGDVD